ncbi:unnamed protein product [Boreogadus saida]
MEEIIDALRSLADDVENNRVEDTDAIDRVLAAKHRVGRPTVEIPLEAIEGYLSHGPKVQEIADMYGVHRTTVHRKMQQNDMYSEMSDTQLDALVLEIHRIHLCGYRMLRYHLQGRGHLVQNGFSRLVVFLSAATNCATTVLDAFLGAVRQYGVPSRVRSDKGRENFEVAYYMVDNCGPNRNSHITGRSVHNQSVRTENSQSPYQLWLRNISAVADPPEVDDLYGASVDGPDLEDLSGVDVPEIQLPRDLTAEELSRLPQ